MFDIDHFKLVNDTHGHLIGDRVLANVAKAAKQVLREGDVLVRYGGEEFLCILPGASIEGTAEVCERIRQAIEALVVQDREQAISCTVSHGRSKLDLQDSDPAKSELFIPFSNAFSARASTHAGALPFGNHPAGGQSRVADGGAACEGRHIA